MVLSRYWMPIALVVALHAALLAWMLISHITPPALTHDPVMEVVMIAPPVAQPAPPVPPTPPVQPVKPQPRPVVAPAPKPVVQTPTPVPPPPVSQPQPKAVVVPPAPPPPAPVPPKPAPEPVVTPPRVDASYAGNPKPPYPRTSGALGEAGTVHLRIYVNADGTVGDVKVEKSSGYFRLDDSARDTVKHWKLTPAKRGDQPIAMWYSLPINFNLNEAN